MPERLDAPKAQGVLYQAADLGYRLLAELPQVQAMMAAAQG